MSQDQQQQKWECPKCTFSNHDLMPTCEVCEHKHEVISSAVVDLVEIEDTFDLNNVHYQDNSCSAVAVNSFDLLEDTSCSTVAVKSTSFDEITAGNSNTGILELMVASFKKKSIPFISCNPHCLHITQTGSFGSRWSCGYRNIQMMCSALMTQEVYRKVLFDGSGLVGSCLFLQSL